MPLVTETEYKNLLRPVCRVPAGALASEVCDAGTAGEKTDEALEDLDADTLEAAIVAGFEAEERGDSYQDGWHSVVDPVTATIRRDRDERRTEKGAAMADKKTDCGCDRAHADDDDANYDLMGNVRPEARARIANSSLGQQSSYARGANAATEPARADSDDSEDAANAALKAATSAAWSNK